MARPARVDYDASLRRDGTGASSIGSPFMTSAASLTIALGEYDTGWHAPAESVAHATGLIARAAGGGARLVMLPEMCASGFTMESDRWAEAPDGPSATRLAEAASTHGVFVLAGLSTTRGGRHYNSALLFTPEGTLAAAYDKQRRFAFAGEDRAYAAGASSVIVEIDGVRAGLFICYDLRFPELFRAVGPYVDALLLVANWPASRQSHWSTLLPARAVENQAYVVGVNRVGMADDLSYVGGSAAFDPWGDAVETVEQDGVRLVTVTTHEVSRVRSRFPFIDDRRSSAPPVGPFAPDWPAGAVAAR
jgi:omega-amidase